ncbi:hypothetical protein SAMD00019534_118720 [Acytostelium subglobosum LB1]|uniref:hypothetical protein n=1 Tax=Acytostelium subglobosum LB1 TaxID=1410327 RepID=UPI000644FED6|nr:hypothetical protein SAMD00019534_118720 [Acytostelium subglobosum LB1]GAM28696.1 hypothetical protein SAMD00019534_118720 [Acytostelium subglobosum LB1]|eukprot:XP_012748474.1 hypothetical protein SAMD00019534_118720 [Acytostelium subglobosum LB1]
MSTAVDNTYTNDTLFKLISSAALEQKSTNAMILPSNTTSTDFSQVTYGQFLQDAVSVAHLLQSNGFKQGDVVSIVLPNGYPILACFAGTTFSRCIAAPLNSSYKEDEFNFYLQDMNAKLVIIQDGLTEAKAAATQLGLNVWTLKDNFDYASNQYHFELFDQKDNKLDLSSKGTELADPPQPEDVAIFLHTSGTTSKPKGVPLTHKNISTSLVNIAKTFHLSKTDRSMVVMPLFHVHGLIGVSLSTLISGGSLITPPKFSAQCFWAHVKQHKATWYSAVPTIHAILISLEKSMEDSPNKAFLRFIRSCSSSLSPTLFESLEKCYGCPVVESYGMTESSHQMTSNRLPEDGKRKVSSVGKGAFVEVGIANEEGNLLAVGQVGEVCTRGNNVMKGYNNNPTANIENFTKQGWFLTGDIGYLDDEGYLFLKGRKKEIINRGGEKISPLEIDNSLLECEHIAEAVCFGVPDAKYGEEIWAAVVPKTSKPDLTEQEVMEFLQKKIVSFKIPKKIFVTDSFPKTTTGKIQRRFISEHFLKIYSLRK